MRWQDRGAVADPALPPALAAAASPQRAAGTRLTPGPSFPPPPVMGAPRRPASTRRLARPIGGAGGRRGRGESQAAGPQAALGAVGAGPRCRTAAEGRARCSFPQCPLFTRPVPAVHSLRRRSRPALGVSPAPGMAGTRWRRAPLTAGEVICPDTNLQVFPQKLLSKCFLTAFSSRGCGSRSFAYFYPALTNSLLWAVTGDISTLTIVHEIVLRATLD